MGVFCLPRLCQEGVNKPCSASFSKSIVLGGQVVCRFGCDPRDQDDHMAPLVYVQRHTQAPVADTGALICKALRLYVGNNLVSTLASKKGRNSLIVSALGGEK